ncbi:unnamed protein product [Closterium sp. NIES-53]
MASLHFVLDSTIDGRSLAIVKEALQRFGHLIAIGQPHSWNYGGNTTPSVSVHHNRWVPESSHFELVQVYPAAEKPNQTFGLRDFNHALSAANLAQSATSLAQRLQRSLSVSYPNSGGADAAPLNPFLMEAGGEAGTEQFLSGGVGSQMAFLASLLRMTTQPNARGSVVEEADNGESVPQIATSKLLAGASCKVIFVCGSILQDPSDESFHSAVMEAATRCVSVDFLVVQPATANKANHHRTRSGIQKCCSFRTELTPWCQGGDTVGESGINRQFFAGYSGDVGSPPTSLSSRLEELEDAVSGYENCSLHCMPCDPVQLDAYTKRWLQHLHSCGADTTIDFALQFGTSKAKSKRAQGDNNGAGAGRAVAPLSITCSAHPTVLQLHDTIQPCLTCRCHGVPLPFPSTLPSPSNSRPSPPSAPSSNPSLPLAKAPSLRCPVSGQRLDASDVTSNTVLLGAPGSGGRRSSGGGGGTWDGDPGVDASRMSRESGGGEEEVWRRGSRGRSRGGRVGRDEMGDAIGGGRGTLLHLPSFKAAMEAPRLHGGSTLAVPLTVVKRNLELDFSNSTELSEMERNEHAFAALCRSLNQHDNGLLCSSLVDADTRMDVSFPCYYLLLPTEAGSLLLRRVASAEELLPLTPRPVSNHGEEDEEKGEVVAAAVDLALSQLEEEAFNPVEVERGCHQRLQWLLKESLYFQPIPPGRQGSNLHSVSHCSRSSSRSPSSSSPSATAATTSDTQGGGSPAQLAAVLGRRERRRSASSLLVAAAGAAAAASGAGAGAGAGKGALPVSASMDPDWESGKVGMRHGSDSDLSAAEDWRFRASRGQRAAQIHQMNKEQRNQLPQQLQQQQQMQQRQQQQMQMQKELSSGHQASGQQVATAATQPLRPPFVPTPPPPRTTQPSFQSPSSGAISSSPSHRKLFPYLSAPPRAPSPSQPSSRFIVTTSPPVTGHPAGRAGVEAVGRMESTVETGKGIDPATATASAAAAAAAAVRAPAQSLPVNRGFLSTPPADGDMETISADDAIRSAAIHATPPVTASACDPVAASAAVSAAAAAAPQRGLLVPSGNEDDIEEGGSAAWAVELERLSSGVGKGTNGDATRFAGDLGEEQQKMQAVQMLPELQLPPSRSAHPQNAPPAAHLSERTPPSGYSRPSLPPALSADSRIRLARRQTAEVAPLSAPVSDPLQDSSNLQLQAQAALAVQRNPVDKPQFSQAPRFASIPGMQRAGMGGGRYVQRVPGAPGLGNSELSTRGGEAGTEGERASGKGSRKGGFRRIRQGKV